LPPSLVLDPKGCIVRSKSCTVGSKDLFPVLGMVMLRQASVRAPRRDNFKLASGPKRSIERPKLLSPNGRVASADSNVSGIDPFQAQVGVGNLKQDSAIHCCPCSNWLVHEPSIVVVAGTEKHFITFLTACAIAFHAPFLLPKLFLPVVAEFPVQLESKGLRQRWPGRFVARMNAIVGIERGTAGTGRNCETIGARLVTYQLAFAVVVAVAIALAQFQRIHIGWKPIVALVLQHSSTIGCCRLKCRGRELDRRPNGRLDRRPKRDLGHSGRRDR
jgi:hypothetical protein